MGSFNEEAVNKVKEQIQELLAQRKSLKDAVAAVNNDLKTLEEYLAYLLQKPVSEISLTKSIPEHLEAIIREKGEPMRVNDLLEEIRSITGLENTALATVTTALIRYSNKGKKFKRVFPNTYDVLEEKEKENM